MVGNEFYAFNDVLKKYTNNKCIQESAKLYENAIR